MARSRIDAEIDHQGGEIQVHGLTGDEAVHDVVNGNSAKADSAPSGRFRIGEYWRVEGPAVGTGKSPFGDYGVGGGDGAGDLVIESVGEGPEPNGPEAFGLIGNEGIVLGGVLVDEVEHEIVGSKGVHSLEIGDGGGGAVGGDDFDGCGCQAESPRKRIDTWRGARREQVTGRKRAAARRESPGDGWRRR